MGLKETHDLIEHLGRKIKKVDVGQKCGCVFGNKEKWEKKEGNKSKWSSNHPPATSFPHTTFGPTQSSCFLFFGTFFFPWWKWRLSNMAISLNLESLITVVTCVVQVLFFFLGQLYLVLQLQHFQHRITFRYVVKQ